MTYAIFTTGGQQFRAEEGVTIKVPLLAAEPGSKVTFDRVLLASDGKNIETGKPTVKGAKVTAEVVRHGKGKKIRIFRFARRTGYRRKAGHRQDFTEVKIADVKVGCGTYGSQERRRLFAQRPRLEPQIPRRQTVWGRVRDGGEHHRDPARHQVPSGQERAPRVERQPLLRGRRPREVRAQGQEAAADQ